MKKKLLFFVMMNFATLFVWAQVPGNPVTTVSGITVCTGAATVDIPIKVSSFTAVWSISLEFAYVGTEINSPTLIYEDPGLTAWGTFLVNTGNAGTIIVSGYDPAFTSPTGLTLDDNTTLFTLRFTIGTITAPAALTFVENTQGTSCEYVGIGPGYATFLDTPKDDYYIAGAVTVVDDPSISVHPVSPDPVCQGDELSPLTITASDGTPSLTYQWYSNTTNSNSGGTSLGSGNGAQTDSYTPPSATEGTLYYYCVVSASGPGCGNASSNTAEVTIIARKKISGTFTYYNSDNTLLTGQDITVKLYKTSDVSHSSLLDTDVTDELGYYEFLNLCPDCDYDILATSTHSSAGAINTTDAAFVNIYGPNPYLIEKVRFHAADVGTSSTASDLMIQASDAGRIQLHFVYGTAFDNSWTFWKTGDGITSATTTESYPSVTLSIGNDLDADMYGLCTGDFNLSFDPSITKSAGSSLDLVYTGNRLVSNNQEFDLPIYIVNAAGVGAVSLILNFPDELVVVQDVIMPGTGGQLDWAVKGHELRIGWNSQNPLDLSAGTELLTLKLKTTAAFIIGSSIKLTLAANPLNELADNRYDVISDAVLSVDVIDATAVGIDEQQVAKMISMNNYPNPFSNFTTITYSLPFEGKVILEISNVLGRKVTTLVSETQEIGGHIMTFNTDDLPEGVYFATLRLKSNSNEWIRTIKLINNK